MELYLAHRARPVQPQPVSHLEPSGSSYPSICVPTNSLSFYKRTEVHHAVVLLFYFDYLWSIEHYTQEQKTSKDTHGLPAIMPQSTFLHLKIPFSPYFGMTLKRLKIPYFALKRLFCLKMTFLRFWSEKASKYLICRKIPFSPHFGITLKRL